MNTIIFNKCILIMQILTFVFLPGCIDTKNLPDQTEDMPTSTTSPCNVVITRENKDILNESGEILAVCFYEKPVLQWSNLESITAINQYFENESKAFFSGQYRKTYFPNNRIEIFRETVENLRGVYGDSVLIASPLEYTVTTEITYLDTQTISIKETVYWMAGGVGKHHYFGVNFNLSTGQPISLKDISYMGIKDFNVAVSTALCNYYSQNNIVYTSEDVTTRNESSQFDDYNFYYDDSNIFLVFSEDEYFNGTYIVTVPNEDKGTVSTTPKTRGVHPS